MKLTVFYGTETGNSRELAEKVAKKGAKVDAEVAIVDLAETTIDAIAAVKGPILVIISTWDDGVPPPNCVAIVEALMSASVDLSHLSYTVLALGDTEYPQFCECGKQVDARLEALGATRFMERTDLDADFMVSYMGWSKRFWATLAEHPAAATA